MSESKSLKIEVGESGRDYALLTAEAVDGKLANVQLKIKGCHAFLLAGQKLREQLSLVDIASLSKVDGAGHVGQLYNELILRLREEWRYPYEEVEICHCRQVSTQRVDAAIIHGAPTAAEVARKTSAGTGCGTCRPDIEKIIEYRKKL